MDEYLKQAKDFLDGADAKCEIIYGGIARNENWKENLDMKKLQPVLNVQVGMNVWTRY